MNALIEIGRESVPRMLFDKIASLLETEYGIMPESLQKPCCEEFERCFPDFDQYFPELTYQYTSKQISENMYGYECTGNAPSWRPANASQNI